MSGSSARVRTNTHVEASIRNPPDPGRRISQNATERPDRGRRGRYRRGATLRAIGSGAIAEARTTGARRFRNESRTYLVARKREHEEANPVAYAIGSKHIRAKCRLTIRSRWHQRELTT